MQNKRIRIHRGPAATCSNTACHPQYEGGGITAILTSDEFRRYARAYERQWDDAKEQRQKESGYTGRRSR